MLGVLVQSSICTNTSNKHRISINTKMFSKIAFASGLLTASVSAQGAGTQKTETHPTMTWQSCTSPSSCTTNNGEVVIGMF